MSQFQKNIDNVIQNELDKIKKNKEDTDANSKRIAKKVKPQTSIDELIEKAKEQDHQNDEHKDEKK